MHTVTVARHAMATRFEILLHGEDAISLRAAAEEALDEIERLEAQLSLFRPTSEIARVNRLAAREPVRITPPVWRLLAHARQLWQETGGAFDITVAPLVRCWGFLGDTGRLPTAQAVADARACVGMHLVDLDPAGFTVRFQREGVMLDLGAIGKGYAIDRAVEVLQEGGVTSAFLHGGTSSSYGLGQPPDVPVWKAAIPCPELRSSKGESPGQETSTAPVPASANPTPGRPGGRDHPSGSAAILATVSLQDESLGVSGVRGKCFEAQGRVFGHVLDPRTGEPVQGALLAAVVLPSATESDALSTALITLGPTGLDQIARLRPGLRALVVPPPLETSPLQVHAHGLFLAPSGAPCL